MEFDKYKIKEVKCDIIKTLYEQLKDLICGWGHKYVPSSLSRLKEEMPWEGGNHVGEMYKTPLVARWGY
jgi:hypothetical protein